MLRILWKTPLELASVGLVLLAVGCSGGNVGQAIRGIQNLEPELEKRDRQVEELTRPAGNGKDWADE
jgi:hypothetical protein